MFDLARSAPLHRWLFGIAIGLTLLAPVHAMWVFAGHPSPFLGLHYVTAGSMWVFAEQRRQWKAKLDSGTVLAEMLKEAEHARR